MNGNISLEVRYRTPMYCRVIRLTGRWKLVQTSDLPIPDLSRQEMYIEAEIENLARSYTKDSSSQGKALTMWLGESQVVFITTKEWISDAPYVEGVGKIPLINGEPMITESMKKACIGEYWIQYTQENKNGEEATFNYMVDWPIIKKIYKDMAKVAMKDASE